MANMKIGSYDIKFDEVRRIKSDVQIDDQLKNSLAKDGLDEVIFRQGDELFIAYRDNADFDDLKLNLDVNQFSVDDAYNAGQLSVDGDAVQVLFIDDENKDSFWVEPFKAVGNGARNMVNNSYGKAALLGFVMGAATTIAGRNLETGIHGGSTYSNPLAGSPINPTQLKAFNGIAIGGGIGTTLGALKAGAEAGDEKDFWETGAALAAGAGGFGAGALAGWGGDALVKAAKNNPAVAAVAGGVAALAVGTGVTLDLMDANDKPANYRTINRISVGQGQ